MIYKIIKIKSVITNLFIPTLNKHSFKPASNNLVKIKFKPLFKRASELKNQLVYNHK